MKHSGEKDVCDVSCVNAKLVARLRRLLPHPFILREAADTFSVLGDTTRLKIIFALSREKELCVCDIANMLGLTISAASHQLRKLRDRGTVSYRNDGKMVYYSIADGYIERLLAGALVHVSRSSV